MDHIGRYEILAEVGRGAMGIVYRARDTKIGREVAIKTIRLSDKVDPSEVSTLRERLFREAQSAGRLSHPGIVTIYDIAEEGDIAYISMEFVDGRTIDHLIGGGTVRPHKYSATVVGQAAAALDYAHSRDIVHRDVKPANLMVTSDERVKITDFGIARVSSSQLTQTGTVMGTPSYMSPEQVKGDPIDGRSDQFSLAVIAYEMLTGQKPFAGENLTSVMFKIVSDPPVEPKVHNPDISKGVQDALLKALSKNPAGRYPACSAFAAAFASELRESQTAYSLPTETAGIRQDASGDTADVDATAPLRAVKAEELEKTSRVSTPASLPPLASPPRGGAAIGGSTPGVSTTTTRRRRASTGRAWAIAAVGVLLGGAALFAVLNPALLDDPAGWIQATISTEELESRMSSSIGLLLEKNRSPLPPREVTRPIEQAVRQRPSQAPAPRSETPPADQLSAQAQTQTTAPVQASETVRSETPPAAAPAKAAPAAPRRAATVAVNLRTTTPGAQVIVDRDPRWSCVSPCSLELPRGRHVATANLAGYRSYPKIFEANNGPADVQIQMSQITGTLLISSEPTGAEVYVDGRRVSGSTNLQQDLPPGYHTIRVTKQGTGGAERSVRVREGGLHPVHFVLRQEGTQTGRLIVTSTPTGADIVVNDQQRVGRTPREVELAPGRYRVALSREGYRPVIREIELTAGQRQTFEATLTPLN